MPFTVGQYLTANDLKSQEDAHTLGYGVVSGLKVVPTDPASMNVQVETGKAYVADTLVEKGAVTNLTVSGADPTNPRKDIVVCNSAGTLSIVAGTPEAALPSDKVGVYTLNPEPPSIPANSIILAEIWVPAGATEITGSEIYDKRVFTVDRLDMGRMPDMALDKVMVGQGAGSSPIEEDKPAGDTISFVACDIVRNSNDTQRETGSGSWTKLKETLLNEDLSYCRLKFDMRMAGAADGRVAYAEVRKNGELIGNSYSSSSSSWSTKSQDFSGWVADDLIQIWAYATYHLSPCQVRNMRLHYCESITHLGGIELDTPLPTAKDPTISVTNQDP